MKANINQRRAGILLHITSLPSRNLGKDAYAFVDFLHECGASVWQVLPLGITHEDNSPYQSLSAHAGNTALVNVNYLVTQGWLTETECCEEKTCHRSAHFWRQCLFTKAFQNFEQHASNEEQTAFDTFCKTHHYWLDDFALFSVLREKFNQQSWNMWPIEFKNRNLAALNDIRFFSQGAINTVKFEQYIFFKQWSALKNYANERGVLLFGDLPIFVSYDSVDVWANRKVFKLNDEGEMSVVAGVPPDYFSQTGQRWGNPHYDWIYLQSTGFNWWIERMQTQSALFDIVRIDHFRGLEAAWEIPADEPTAINGQWVKAGGEALLEAIFMKFQDITLVAEDLGVITPDVDALRMKFNLAGMKILQFAFSGESDNPYLPENHTVNSVVYTGTHDNDTTLGWLESLTPEQRVYISCKLGAEENDIPSALIQCTLASIAELAIIPMQDILELDGSHRMNTPGTTENNWLWHFQWKQLSSKYVTQFTRLIEQTNRQCRKKD